MALEEAARSRSGWELARARANQGSSSREVEEASVLQMTGEAASGGKPTHEVEEALGEAELP